MPRVFRKTKNRGGHHIYTCDKCGNEIEAGTDYLTWKFNRGSRYFRHPECGYPHRSELSHSKMGGLWDAVDDFDVSGCASPDEIKEALEAVASAAREVATEYSEAVNNIEQAFPSGNNTSEACRATADELEGWADELEGWEPSEDYDGVETQGDEFERYLESCRDEAQDLVNNQPEYQG